MKTETIGSMVAAGVSPSNAERYWAAVRDKLCDGDEPSKAGLALLRDEQVRSVLPALGAEAFISAIRAPEATPRPRKFKAGKVYSPGEYVAFYVADPKTPGLVEQLSAATDGHPWLIVKNGQIRESESEQYLRWHLAEDPAPVTIDVDGEPVAPILPGQEQEARLYYVDPFDPGAFLDVNFVSAGTGARFRNYSDEALSAMAFLFRRNLLGEGALSLNRLATECSGKSAAEILAPFPATLAAWNKLKPEQRPAARRAKEDASRRLFDGAPTMDAAHRSPPLVYVVGAAKMRAKWEWLSDFFAPAARAGLFRIVSDADAPGGTNTSMWNASFFDASAAIIALLSADTLAMAETTFASRGSRLFFPVRVSPCYLDLSPIGGLAILPHGDACISDVNVVRCVSAIASVMRSR